MSGQLLLYVAALAWLLNTAGTNGGETTWIPAQGNRASAAAQSGEEEEMTDAGSTSENSTGSGDEQDYCPGYKTGNPGRFSTETADCATGAEIGVVDHMLAFGIGSHVRNPNWTVCGIPFLPNENERVCYKTTVYQCQDGYRIYLNCRNPHNLLSPCANETDEIPPSPLGGRFLQSPRYGCLNSPDDNNFMNYRNSEFCLYDLSLPECTSGRLVIDNALHYTQEMERRQRYHICTDYLQFFTDGTPYQRFCDSELSRLKLEIPNTRVTVLFWTDTSYNKLGFKLRVTCAEDST